MTDTVQKQEGVLPSSKLSPETQQLVEQVQATKRPLIITRDGECAAVLMEAGEYELLKRRLALMERILQGERDFADGHTYTHEEVEALMDSWLADGK